MTRRDVTFDSNGTRCAAWLRPAAGAAPGERRPCVILAHGFAGVREARLDAYAERFAAAGLHALVFDYRHFGASGGEPRQLLSIRRQHEDWHAAIAYARGLPDVDPERIALWGTSFSGGHVAVVAAKDPRVAAVISQGPFFDGVATLRFRGLRNVARLTAAGLRDAVAALRRRPPVYVPAVGPPGTTAAMTSPDAEPGYRALFDDDRAFDNRVAGRVLLAVGGYRPIARAAKVAAPWLFCICDRDAVTPPGPALAAAARAPRGEVRRYDCGHFDIYVPPVFEQAVADQVEFLRRHVLRAEEAATPAGEVVA
ncbi:MAG: alpha/beta fold hydrolase [Solirubrobacterales bacterium]|nr:alpha/beta fold hydrolase [Solirubrobacterales bacterium]